MCSLECTDCLVMMYLMAYECDKIALQDMTPSVVVIRFSDFPIIDFASSKVKAEKNKYFTSASLKAGILSCFSVSLLSCKISKIPRFPGLQVFSSLRCSRIVL